MIGDVVLQHRGNQMEQNNVVSTVEKMIYKQYTFFIRTNLIRIFRLRITEI